MRYHDYILRRPGLYQTYLTTPPLLLPRYLPACTRRTLLFSHWLGRRHTLPRLTMAERCYLLTPYREDNVSRRAS